MSECLSAMHNEVMVVSLLLRGGIPGISRSRTEQYQELLSRHRGRTCPTFVISVQIPKSEGQTAERTIKYLSYSIPGLDTLLKSHDGGITSPTLIIEIYFHDSCLKVSSELFNACYYKLRLLQVVLKSKLLNTNSRHPGYLAGRLHWKVPTGAKP